VVPAIVAGILVALLAVYFLFGELTSERRSVESYLADIERAEGNRRWQAAFEMSRLIEAGGGEVGSDTGDKVLAVFDGAAAGASDPRIRRYLALTLGRLRFAAAVPSLLVALGDADAETRIYAALALGEIADRRATAPLLVALSDEDAGVRKAAAFSLGLLADPEAAPRLREAIHDREVDVTWNAAVALARMGDPSGRDVLRSMAHREFVERASRSGDPGSRSTVLMTAVRALAMIEDHGAVPALEALAASDPDLRVRQVAMEALESLRRGEGRGAPSALTSEGGQVQ
jgi:hypothetical protein